MNIPEEVLREAALEVLARMPPCQACDDQNTDHCEFCRNDSTEFARAALSAAAPTLMAMALRDAARDLSWFGAQGNTVEPNTAWAGVTACMNALNNIADALEGK